MEDTGRPTGHSLATSVVMSWDGGEFPPWAVELVRHAKVFYTDMLFTDAGCLDAVLVKLTTKIPKKMGEHTHCYASGINNEADKSLHDRCVDAALKACANLAKFLQANQ